MAATQRLPAAKAQRADVLPALQDPETRDRLHAVIREQQLTDEVIVEGTLDGALRHLRTGLLPRVMVLDISDAAAPIAEISAARAAAGPDVKLVVLGVVNDVTFFRDLLSAGATDYIVKPPSREALVAALEQARSHSVAGAEGRLGDVIVFIGSRGGVGTTTAAVSCAWLLAQVMGAQRLIAASDPVGHRGAEVGSPCARDPDVWRYAAQRSLRRQRFQLTR
jgi:pilus assembly protein CpaE